MTKKSSLRVVVACYAVAFCLWLLVAIVTFTTQSIGRANGSIATEVLDAHDLLVGDCIQNEDGSFTTTSADPQMIVQHYEGRVVSASITIQTTQNLGEVNLYYIRTTEPFSAEQKIWGGVGENGLYNFTLAGGVYNYLRFDPASVAGVTFTVENITLNPPVSAVSFFTPSYTVIFRFLTWPLLAAALLVLAAQLCGVTEEKLHTCFAKFRSHKKQA